MFRANCLVAVTFINNVHISLSTEKMTRNLGNTLLILVFVSLLSTFELLLAVAHLGNVICVTWC